MSEDRFFVYLLWRMDTRRVFYVGETRYPDRRFQQHMDGFTPRTAFIIEPAKRAGVEIRMQVVAEFDTRKEARDYEAELIDRARRADYWIVNDHIPPHMPEYERQGKRWESGERERIRRMYEEERRSIKEIARSVLRSGGAIISELRKMGVAIQW